MNDTFSRPNITERPLAREEAGQSLAPLWIFKVMNPIMKGLLRSPLHRLLCGILMLLMYTGCKTGKQYTIPIGYFVWGQGELMSFSSARWWTNLRSSPPVRLLLKLPFPVLVDPDRAVYRRYGLDKVLIALQRGGTFLIDKQGIMRYIHQVTNPQASVEKEELMREVEKLQKEKT